MFILVLIFLFLIFRTLYLRFKKNPAGSLLNPLFYLVFLCAFYLLLPLLYLDYILEIVEWYIPQRVVTEAYLWSFWYMSVFYAFYCLSKDHYYKFSDQCPGKFVVRYAFVLYILITLLLIFIVLAYCPTVYAVKNNREVAIQIYESTINGRFKLRILMYVHLSAIFVLFWRYRKYRYLLPCLLYLLIDYSHGGRTVSVMIFFFVYFLIILQKRKTYLFPAFCVALSLIIFGLLQRSNSSGLLWNMYLAGAEFSNTYLTTVYLLQHPDYTLNGLHYGAVALSKILPGGLVDKVLDFGEWYGNQLSADINLGYGLAGNLISEALVYGGKVFAFFNPFLIATCCFFLNTIAKNKKLFTILFVFLICISMQNIVRSYFWGFILYPFQILLFFLFGFTNDYLKKVFQ